MGEIKVNDVVGGEPVATRVLHDNRHVQLVAPRFGVLLHEQITVDADTAAATRPTLFQQGDVGCSGVPRLCILVSFDRCQENGSFDPTEASMNSIWASWFTSGGQVLQHFHDTDVMPSFPNSDASGGFGALPARESCCTFGWIVGRPELPAAIADVTVSIQAADFANFDGADTTITFQIWGLFSGTATGTDTVRFPFDLAV